MPGKRIAREGSTVFLDGREIGQVTSGTFSPTLQKPIAMAYVDKGSAETGQAVEVDIRGKREAATRRQPAVLSPARVSLAAWFADALHVHLYDVVEIRRPVKTKASSR